MEQITLTLAHWVYLSGIVAIFVFMILRRDVILPSIISLFALGIVASSQAGGTDVFIGGAQIIFRAFLNAGVTLFDIMLVIALMGAMLKSLQAQGSDIIMIKPMQRLMVNPTATFFVLGGTMYLAATFFWPTPAVALVGTVLIPVAVRAGLPAIAAAVAINICGHGMALSGDLVIQGATKLTSTAAGVSHSAILPYTGLFSIIVGVTAVTFAYLFIYRDMKNGTLQAPDNDETLKGISEAAATTEVTQGKYAKHIAIIVPVALFGIVLLMVYRAIYVPENAIRGESATSLLGGTAVVLLVISSIAHQGSRALEEIVSHLREGFLFAIKIFAPLIPIAGFFFLGHPKHAETVIGEGAPGYLFDIGMLIGNYIGDNIIILTLGIVFIALIVALDGSAFSGLPLIGALSASLGASAGVDVAILASLGQVVTIFAGGGTLMAWGFGLVADAGVAGVKPADVVRRNLIPTMIGISFAAILAIFLMTK
ncbi:membrane protein [Siminovitchia terrae]|uniref:Membrane protein n=1 Tax=Siminovitchia terrae TaxID=1914933 RepID=A0A429X532_SIMTE|nr:hypothetical protein [Siminovitchia terrae]RST58410.1 hypothetical protein D5F11_017310 [Siminovitchia terrae]GIN94006.1 membrane protein [Siminovitchia terrae]GIN96791.1 membrane protein [Siminovitchia terrae]